MNIRTLLREINTIQDKLPITITRYGQPIFIIIPVEVVYGDSGWPIGEKRDPLGKAKSVGKDGVL